MVKIPAIVGSKKKVWSIMEKQKMILDTNLKLIKDGNISVLYMQSINMNLSGKEEPYQFVLLNINNK